MYTKWYHGLLRWCNGKESTCKRHRRCRFDPWLRKIPWSRKCHPTPVFLPGESHRQRSLVRCSPQDHEELDMAKHARTEWYQQSTRLTVVAMAICPLSSPSQLTHHCWIYQQCLNKVALTLFKKLSVPTLRICLILPSWHSRFSIRNLFYHLTSIPFHFSCVPVEWTSLPFPIPISTSQPECICLCYVFCFIPSLSFQV